jgi:hypothetical protein
LRALTSGRSLDRQDAVQISSLDGPSSPPSQSSRTQRSPNKQAVEPSHLMLKPTASRPRSSAHFLEPGPSDSGLGDSGPVPRINSPGRRSPQPLKTKRKATPPVFMETKRPRVAPSSLGDLF